MVLSDSCSTLFLSTIWSLCMFKTWHPVLYSQHRPDDATKATTCYCSWHLVNKQILCNPGAVMFLYHSVLDSINKKFLYFENQSRRNIDNLFFLPLGLEGQHSQVRHLDFLGPSLLQWDLKVFRSQPERPSVQCVLGFTSGLLQVRRARNNTLFSDAPHGALVQPSCRVNPSWPLVAAIQGYCKRKLRKRQKVEFKTFFH